ncbi:regulatory protein RecX [Sphingomonas naphthae]|uniref:Regulatory protein RecX n=1 Tax=Sphingomonas naphthae TaxID=1813468 RepID=A0ABY7TJN6_9SPHN|nr:regulatory protein RecX [Sphingomonas naphthae]WCT73369.1 regulatory protein RecX [Sphingomonas naphthae]
MTRLPHNRKPTEGRPPLDAARLEALALSYCARFATTRAKLATYLRRKVQERGFGAAGAAEEDARPPIEAIVEKMTGFGYIDDAAFAEAKGRSLTRRGYGARRIGEALKAAGVAPEDAAEANGAAEDGKWDSALAFARKRRFGPYAAEPLDPDAKRRAFAAMMRAGHGPEVARRILQATPGEEIAE